CDAALREVVDTLEVPHLIGIGGFARKRLELALPNIKKRDERSRVNFILAQLYQEQNNDTKAFEHYTAVVKGNPPYELGFHARLNMGQVTNLANAGNTKKIYKYYNKLLKDEKNKEYQDKIYYEMARFELKQGNNQKGLSLLNKSLRVKSENSRQRSATHLLMGQTYYDKLQNYRMAAAYYDSTVMFMAATSPDYAYTKDRRDILREFVTQLTIIETEDSLQMLASMSESDLSTYLDKLIAEEQAKQEKELAEQQKKLEQQQTQPQDAFLVNDTKGGQPTGKTGGSWYFYNMASVGAGQNEFARTWGNRKLEDNWRRANKTANTPVAQEGGTEAGEAKKDSAATQELTEEQIAAQKAKAAADRKAALMSRIPRGKEQLAASTERLQNAYFALGNIYNLELNEPKRATETFEKLLQRFPAHPKKVEVYYSLYLIFTKLKDDPNAAKYRALIISEFPTSTYAKLLSNPNYLKENLVKNEAARDLFDSAYVLYEKGNYPRARNLVASVQKQYPQNDIPDHLSLLQVLITGRMDTLSQYKQGLENFIATYKSSKLVPYAQQLLGKYNEFANKSPEQLAKVNKAEKAEYLTDISGPHTFVLIYSAKDKSFRNISTRFSDFNEANYSIDKLKSSDIALNDSTVMMSVKEFKNDKAALLYLDRMKGKFSPLEEIPGSRYKMFVISNENFPIFYKSKNIGEYMAFFRKRYF
ncbi:MAG: tetratricopeptide repeat protein, partial [Chitinophagaceae bacterium]